jgi:hypothetical protein
MNAESGPEPEPESGPESGQSLTPQERAARRRRLAEVFGDVLPEQTSDDADQPQARTEGSDAWLKRQVPPHHGQ